jgi:hypothetical protein
MVGNGWKRCGSDDGPAFTKASTVAKAMVDESARQADGRWQGCATRACSEQTEIDFKTRCFLKVRFFIFALFLRGNDEVWLEK